MRTNNPQMILRDIVQQASQKKYTHSFSKYKQKTAKCNTSKHEVYILASQHVSWYPTLSWQCLSWLKKRRRWSMMGQLAVVTVKSMRISSVEHWYFLVSILGMLFLTQRQAAFIFVAPRWSGKVILLSSAGGNFEFSARHVVFIGSTKLDRVECANLLWQNGVQIQMYSLKMKLSPSLASGIKLIWSHRLVRSYWSGFAQWESWHMHCFRFYIAFYSACEGQSCVRRLSIW